RWIGGPPDPTRRPGSVLSPFLFPSRQILITSIAREKKKRSPAAAAAMVCTKCRKTLPPNAPLAPGSANPSTRSRQFLPP
uniref:Uncharacterized protein n=1 Tax=Aegilops tauschii subsp. strangulata TaxID=200361 RepID=A0A453QW04_AEGTS